MHSTYLHLTPPPEMSQAAASTKDRGATRGDDVRFCRKMVELISNSQLPWQHGKWHTVHSITILLMNKFRRSPVDIGKYPIILQGVKNIPRWCRISSITISWYQKKCWNHERFFWNMTFIHHSSNAITTFYTNIIRYHLCKCSKKPIQHRPPSLSVLHWPPANRGLQKPAKTLCFWFLMEEIPRPTTGWMYKTL